MAFVPRPGTKDRGGEYEVNMTALYALRFSLRKDVCDLTIASNVDGYGAFDDVIIRVNYISGNSELLVIQLKHKTGKKIRLLKTDFDKPKSEFALRKYKDSYFKDIKRKFKDDDDILMKGLSLEDIKMCLVTNANVENFKIVPLNSNLLSCRSLHDPSQDFIDSGSNGYYQFRVNKSFQKLPQYFCECLGDSFCTTIIRTVKEKFHEFTDVRLLEEIVRLFQEKLRAEFENESSSFVGALKIAAAHANSRYKIDNKIFNVMKNCFAEDLKTAQNIFATKLFHLEEYKEYLRFRGKSCSEEEEDLIRSTDAAFFQNISAEKFKEIIGRFFKDEEERGMEAKGFYDRLHKYYQYEFKLEKQYEYSEFFHRFWFYDGQVNYKEAQNMISETLKTSFGEEGAEITENFIQFIKDHFDEGNSLLTKVNVKLKLLELLTSGGELNTRYKIFEHITDINDPEQRGEILRNIKISLQGRRPLSLNELTTKEFQDKLSAKFLLENLNQTVLVGTDETKIPNNYTLTRKFYKIILRKEVLWETKHNIFILDVAFPADLNNKVLVVDDPESNDFSALRFTDKNLIVILEGNELPCTVNRIKKQNGDRFSIHYMKVCDSSCLEWQSSWGEVDKLKIFTIKNELVDERDLLTHFSNLLNVVASNPGMGKSTVLNSLGIYCEPNRLVLKLDLNAHSKALQDEQGELKRNPLEYICNIMKLKNENAFEDDLFDHLRDERKVTLFIDSFDEISPKYSEATLSIINHVQKKSVPTWVFTRPFAESLIEKRFYAIAIRMKGFAREDIEDYLRRRWGLTTEARLFLTEKTVSFYEVPHYLHMLANICKTPADLPELKITDLYKQFIEKAFDEHLERRKLDKEANQTALMISEYRETYLKVHTTAALCVVFGRQYLKENRMIKGKAIVKMDRHFSGDKLNFELIVAMEGEIPIFSHRTYAEYLAAAWLYKKLSKKKFKESYRVLLKEENESVRLMFDRLSAENSPLHLAVLEGDLEKADALCRGGKGTLYEDTFGRTPLHFAMSYLFNTDIGAKRNYKAIKIADLLAFHFKGNDAILKHQDSLSDSDFFIYSEKTGNFYQLHIAAYWGAMNILRLMLARKNIRLERQDDLYGWMALHAASFAGLEECVQLLIERGAGVHLKTLYARETAMHLAAGKGHIHILKFLLQNGGTVSVFDSADRTVLQYACCGGLTDSVRYLIEIGEDINLKNETGKQTAVHFAAKNGHVETLKLLLEKGGNVDDGDSHNWTPLHFASRFGHAECARYLIEMGASIHSKTRGEETPMFLAAREGHLDVLKLFIEKNGDLNSWGFTSLTVALRHRRIKCARYLLENGVDISVKNEQLIHNAARQGDVEILKLLIKVSGDINKPNSREWTTLHTASYFGSTECVRFLLETGANKKLKTNNNKTPMHLAAIQGHADILRILGGENIDDVDSFGYTALQLSSRYEHLECVRLLVKMGADINLKSKGNKTSLHYASEGGHLHILKVLIDNGGDVNQADSEGWTPLHFASDFGKLDCVRYLIDMGASITPKTTSQEIPLDFAAEKGHLETLRFLMENWDDRGEQLKLWAILTRASNNNHVECIHHVLDNYFKEICAEETLIHLAIKKGLHQVVKFCINNFGNINEVDSQGRTPLHSASFYGQTECMKYLIAAGADVNLKVERDGKTSMHIGAEEGHVEVLKLLTRHGGKVDAIDSYGRSALHLAALGGGAGCVRYLIDREADVNMRAANGATPLHFAVQKGHSVVLNLLIIHKGNVNEVDSFGRTPMDYILLNAQSK